MDKLKQTFSRNKADEPSEDPASASGRLSGPGSHFRSAKESTGLDSTTETTGSENTALPSTKTESTTAPESSTIEPSAGAAAAVGETSTYSSTPLATGDPTSSVIDTESKDPLTYQKPEATYGSSAGVPEGAATIAASKAFGGRKEQMPGTFPSQDAPESTDSTSQTTGVGSGAATDRSSGTGAATALGAGAATADAAGTTTSTSPDVPSTLTSTTGPGERHETYGEAEKSKGLDGTDTGERQQSGMIGKVLGAVGLGSVAGAGVAKATSDNRDTAVADTPDQPTTTTGIGSSTAPQQSRPPPSHHRKESIPTTAYPGGVDSPRAVAPPIGGTQRPAEVDEPTSTQDSSRGRDAALGVGAVGTGAGALGAGAYAARDHDANRTATDDKPATSTYDAVTTDATPATERERQEEQERKRLEEEEADRKRHEKEAAGVMGAGAAGAGTVAYEAGKNDEARTPTEGTKDSTDGGPVEKKPSLLKRIFKRTRKNKDTGEDEEYEEEGEEDDSHNGAAAATAGIGAAGAGAAYYATRDNDKPTTTTDTTDTTKPESSYEAASGGMQKPSYNPFKSNKAAEQEIAEGRTGERVPYETEATPATTTSRATEETAPTSVIPGTAEGDTLAVDSTGIPIRESRDESGKPIEPITGLAYDPSKDPEAAKRIEQRNYVGADLMQDAQEAKQERLEAGETPGDIASSGEKKSLGQKIKEKLSPGSGGVKEEDEALRTEGHKHRSEM